MDMFIIRHVLKKKAQNCEVLEFTGAREALQFFNSLDRTKFPDLVIADLNMPDINGHEVVRTIKSSALLEKIPVAVLTSSDSPVDRDLARRNGADSYTTKPLTPEKADKILSLVKE